MKKLFLIAFAAIAFAFGLTSCSDDAANSTGNTWNMHYFFTDYGGTSGTLYSAMIRSPENSDVAILSTTEKGKGGDLYEGYFVQLKKSKSGNTYTFTGSKNGTTYSVTGKLENVSNGTTNNSFTIESSSDAMAALGFTVGKAVQHWTKKTSGSFVY